jgi:hypothetical protein
VRQTSQFNQSKNNRYQQTWHTIEFSNNKHVGILFRARSEVLSPRSSKALHFFAVVCY